MALQHPFKTPHGVTANYHRIIKAEFDMLTKNVSIVLAIYATPENRDEGSQPLWHEYVNVPYSTLPTDPREALYALVTTLDTYKGATPA